LPGKEGLCGVARFCHSKEKTDILYHYGCSFLGNKFGNKLVGVVIDVKGTLDGTGASLKLCLRVHD
jgi:hypothetical protein